MKLADYPLALTFDDVSLVPVHSSVRSRKEPDTSTVIGGQKYKIPIFASPMNSVCEQDMAIAMGEMGAAAVVHRYMTIEKQVEISERIRNYFYNIGYSEAIEGFVPSWFAVGATGDYLERTQTLYNASIRKICIDVANGHSATLLVAVEAIRKAFPDVMLMAGNITSYNGAYQLASVGVNAIRVGIGNGSACKTRVVTGFGVPLLSALEECWELKKIYPEVALIADGGCRSSGDMVKALCFSDAIMTGRLLAGTDETPGKVIDNSFGSQTFPFKVYGVEEAEKLPIWKPGKWKRYQGMASKEGREFNGWFSEENSSFVPEGISTEVPYQGPASKVIENLVGGIKVGMSYAGARTLEELRKNAKWVRVTNAGFQEGLPRQ